MNEVLSIEENNIKALYRRAVAFSNLGDYTNAKEDLNDALKLDPNNVDI